MKTKNILWKLFISTFYLSAFTFGGGYVIITLMKQKFVDEYHWIEEDEILDLVAIAQSAPGPIAINGAISIGYKIKGFIGSFIAILGTTLPPLILLSIISFFYQAFISNVYIKVILQGMQAGVGALICSVVIDMILNMEKSKLNFIIMILVFVLNYLFDVNIIYLIIGCIALGILLSRKKVSS